MCVDGGGSEVASGCLNKDLIDYPLKGDRPRRALPSNLSWEVRGDVKTSPPRRLRTQPSVS